LVVTAAYLVTTTGLWTVGLFNPASDVLTDATTTVGSTIIAAGITSHVQRLSSSQEDGLCASGTVTLRESLSSSNESVMHEMNYTAFYCILMQLLHSTFNPQHWLLYGYT
jgi:hypothetical protein